MKPALKSVKQTIHKKEIQYFQLYPMKCFIRLQIMIE